MFIVDSIKKWWADDRHAIPRFIRDVIDNRVGLNVLTYDTEADVYHLDYTHIKRADLPPSDTWRIRKEESLAVHESTDDVGVLMVWMGDKLANMRAIYRDFKVEGNAMWQRFNQKNVEEQAWYYRSIARLTERIS